VAERLLRSVSETGLPAEASPNPSVGRFDRRDPQLTASCAEELRSAALTFSAFIGSNRTGFQGGELAVGLEAADGEFVCILDARFCHATGFTKTHHPFLHRSENRNDPDQVGHLNRGYSCSPHAGDFFLMDIFCSSELRAAEAADFSNFNGTPVFGDVPASEELWLQHDTLTRGFSI